MELIGNDIFATKLAFSFSLDHMEVLMTLYQPLLSKRALNLYFTLLSRDNRGQMFEMHHTLCEKMQIRIDELEEARIELEQFLLLRTMIVRKEKSNIYYYVLQLPKTFEQFLKHDLFSRLLLHKVGSDYIRKQIELQTSTQEWQEMEEITSHMKLDFSVWTYEKEDQLHSLVNEINEEEMDDPYARYDIMSYLREVDPKCFALPHDEFTKADIAYINYCGQTYDIQHDMMKRMVSNHYVRATKQLNQEGLKNSCMFAVRRQGGALPEEANGVSIPSNPSDPLIKYSLPPVRFVHELKPNMKLSESEVASFTRLQIEYRFSNEVFNALLEFVWSRTSNFNAKYIDKICAVWSRNDINSLEKALLQLSDPIKPNASTPKKRGTPRIVETMPVYSESSNQDIDVDYEELSSLLKSLEQKKQSFQMD